MQLWTSSGAKTSPEALAISERRVTFASPSLTMMQRFGPLSIRTARAACLQSLELDQLTDTRRTVSC